MPDADSANLFVQIESADAKDEELDRLARQLLREISELNVESVEVAKSGAPPEGTMSAEAEIIGTLAITLLPSVLPPLAALLRDWAERVRTRHQPLKLRLTAGDRQLTLEYDPATTDIHRLMAELMPHLQSSGAGGLHLNSGQDTNIGGDAVGRDKIVNIQAQPGATVIVNPPASRSE